MAASSGANRVNRVGTESERFWRKVKIAENGCWEWIGTVDSIREDGNGGYGRFRLAGGRKAKLERAHRWSFIKYVGPIPDGFDLDHLCRNRKCVNPLHLEPKTRRDNALCGNGISAINIKKTKCPQGHPLSGDNIKTIKLPSGAAGRRCKLCAQLAYARYWASLSPEERRQGRRNK
jgi:hypothetical protein